MTINRSSYRVKVDLTKYLQDARRFSWIYVDCANISIINHVKEHITEVFFIDEPFHLLLDGKDYLPPTEDARVLRENELIAVVPGSGISKENISTTFMGSLTTDDRTTQQQRPVDTTIVDYNQEKYKIRNDVEESCDKTLYNSFLEVCGNDATTYRSLHDETEPDSKPTSLTIAATTTTDNCNPNDRYDSPSHKRKRIRRKRSKNPTNALLSLEKVDSESLREAAVPTLSGVSKHIHFETADDGLSGIHEKNRAIEDGTSLGSTTTPHDDKPVVNLSTLLRLRQCSTPIAFTNKRTKRMECSDTDRGAVVRIEMVENGQSNGNKCGYKGGWCEEPPSDYENLKPDDYSTLQTLTKLHDIIAFKILRIGNEYTPEISDYIIARTIDWCPKKLLYTFEILRGQTQIQSPLGKFSLPDDESNNETRDTANFNFSQLIDPRLIYRKL